MRSADPSYQKLRVLYSFPHKLGAERICNTAWQQVNGLLSAGASVLVYPGVLHRKLPPSAVVRPTLSFGHIRIPYKILGTMRACAVHDWIVARRLEKLDGKVDIIHTWPLGARQTLRVARRMGIPAVYERCCAHTRLVYEVMQKECERIGLSLDRDHMFAFHDDVLRREEEEYHLADRLMCPSDFVAQSFLDKGFPQEQLCRNHYGYDERVYYPEREPRSERRGIRMLFVGISAEIKGLHYALEAWLRSPAHNEGLFLIVGTYSLAYAKKLSSMLGHQSVRVLGKRMDVPELMRSSDVLVLPSIQEGFGLVVAEAIGSGCVPLVSDACTDICKNMENSLVHHVGDVNALARHITMIHADRGLLERLRAACLNAAPNVTWSAAGRNLFKAYQQIISDRYQKPQMVAPKTQ